MGYFVFIISGMLVIYHEKKKETRKLKLVGEFLSRLVSFDN